MITIIRSGYLSDAISANSIPFIKGMDISTNARSGRISSMVLMASIPLAASPTTCMFMLSQSMELCMSLRAEASSSIIITLYIRFFLRFRYLFYNRYYQFYTGILTLFGCYPEYIIPV